MYDKTFINGAEDYDIFREIYKEGKYSRINYNISSTRGGSLGDNLVRRLRDLADLIYLEEKMSNELFNLF